MNVRSAPEAANQQLISFYAYDRKGAMVPTTGPSDDVIRLLCWPLVQFFGTYRSHPE
jgi:hypothetical protein